MPSPIDSDFTAEEYEQRYKRTRKLMSDKGLDAVIVSNEANYVYFTGHRSDQNKVDKARPYMFILPLDGPPVVFTMGFEAGHLESSTHIREFRTYNLFEHTRALAALIKELKLDYGRIGWELGREQQLGMGMSTNDFLELRDMFPNASFVDASEILLRVRAVKSPQEISYIAEAATATSRGLVEAFSAIKVGMTERDVHHLVAEAIVSHAGDGPTDMRVLSGKDHTGKNFNMFATPRKLEPGDTITVDSGVRVRGYACDIARTAVVGEPSKQQREMHEFVVDLNYFCYDYLRVGRTCGDVAKACREELDRLGMDKLSVGRIGHGVGLDCLEYPSLREGEDILIEEGMVFACNPNFPVEFGYFNTEENLVVTDGAPRVLADPVASRELTIVG